MGGRVGREKKRTAKVSSSEEDVKPVQTVDVRLCCLFVFFLIREPEMPTAESLTWTGSESKVQLVFLQDWNCQYNIPNILLYD